MYFDDFIQSTSTDTVQLNLVPGASSSYHNTEILIEDSFKFLKRCLFANERDWVNDDSDVVRTIAQSNHFKHSLLSPYK